MVGIASTTHYYPSKGSREVCQFWHRLIKSVPKMSHKLVRQALLSLAKYNRHIVASILVVGVRGFEPPTSASRTQRATGLRYTPVNSVSWCLCVNVIHGIKFNQLLPTFLHFTHFESKMYIDIFDYF